MWVTQLVVVVDMARLVNRRLNSLVRMRMFVYVSALMINNTLYLIKIA